MDEINIFGELHDIIFGTIKPTIFPCEKCHKETCKGKKECKGFGAYSLCIRVK